METSRERVLKAINHIEPEITPVHIVWFDDLPKWLKLYEARDDFELRDKLGLDLQAGRAVYTGPNSALGLNVWGSDKDVGGASGGQGYSASRGGYPLAHATSVADVERFAWPNPEEFDYDIAATVLRSVPDKARWVKANVAVQTEDMTREDAGRSSGAWLPILCTLFNLFGFEETLVKLRAEPKLIDATIAHLEDFVLEFSRRLFRATSGLADIYWYGDDFAMQNGMIISPKDWRRFLKPAYEKIFGLAHSHGLKVWFHSCGTFRPVLPDLIEAGMDVWETVQAHLPGNEPEVLKREYGKDITFYGAINTQHTLPFGTPEDVRAEVRERIRVLGKGGGYICGGDHTILDQVPVENVLAMLDEARKSHP